MPNFDIGAQSIAPGQGLLMELDPSYQAKQLALKQATAYQNGPPTNPDGSIDLASMARTQFQNGDLKGGLDLMGSGIRFSSLQQPLDLNSPLGGEQSAGGAGGAGPGSSAGVGAPVSSKGANPDVVGYIRTAAQSRGIDPNVALRVAASEGLGKFDPSGNSNPGDGNSSFGPFQLHYGNVAPGGNSVAGLGDDFTAATKLDARDPSTWKQQVDFALDHAAQSGWGAYHGAAAAKIGNWQGIGQPGAGGGVQVAQNGDSDAPGPAAAPTAAPAETPSAAPPPVSDTMYATAKRVVSHFENADPRTMTLDQQRAVTMATGAISRYEDAQGQKVASPGTAGGALAYTGDAPASNQHPFAPPPGATAQPGPATAQPAAPTGQPAPAVTQLAAPRPVPQPPQAAPQAPQGMAQPLPAGGPAPAAAPQLQVGAGGTSASASGGPDLASLPANYQNPGDGARYIRDLTARAAQMSLAGDPRAAVLQAQAKQVQSQLEAAQKFRNDLTLASARANDRYNAANSPGAIAAAGAKAGEEAKARNSLSLIPSVQPDGSTLMIPQSDALASAQAGKPIVSAQPGYVTQGQSNLLTKVSDGSKAYQERQIAQERLDAMGKLMEAYQTGTNSTAFSNAVANLRSYGIPVPDTATANPAAMQQFAKDGYANVLSSMKEQGNKQYAAEVASAVNSNPNPELQPEANASMIAQMQGIKKYYDQNFQDYAKWYHTNKGAADDADFQTSWADKHPLGDYVTAARKEIAPMGVAIPPDPAARTVGQRYHVPGRGPMRWMGNGWSPT